MKNLGFLQLLMRHSSCLAKPTDNGFGLANLATLENDTKFVCFLKEMLCRKFVLFENSDTKKKL